MKTRFFTTSLAFAVGQSFTGNCLAITPFEDNFNAATLNATRWTLAQFENAKLRQSNKRLNFTVGPKSAVEDYAYLELKNNQPGYNENWQVILDVSNTAGFGDTAGIGFWIFNAENTGDVVFFEFYGKGKKAAGGFNASFVLNSEDFGKALWKNPDVSAGSMRMTFSKQTKLFTFYYDETGSADGFQWTRIGTFSVNGVGGDERANWNMNPGSGRFGIRLEAYGNNHLIAGGKAFMDNFVLKAVK